VENSRSAFEAAIASGHAIELDVQLSACGTAMVFHDEGLERLAGISGLVFARTAEQLSSLTLAGTGEGIPTLSEVLALIDGRVPVLIEVKAAKRRVAAPLCRAVAGALEGYPGMAGVMSFNPQVGRWFARHRPDTLRGLVVTEKRRGLRGSIERRVSPWIARPDFLAYDVRHLASPAVRSARKKGMPVFTWTVRSAADTQAAAQHSDQIIFELPALS
jgi:glycerophosphoryl diester phosphodiesterase